MSECDVHVHACLSCLQWAEEDEVKYPHTVKCGTNSPYQLVMNTQTIVMISTLVPLCIFMKGVSQILIEKNHPDVSPAFYLFHCIKCSKCIT